MLSWTAILWYITPWSSSHIPATTGSWNNGWLPRNYWPCSTCRSATVIRNIRQTNNTGKSLQILGVGRNIDMKPQWWMTARWQTLKIQRYHHRIHLEWDIFPYLHLGIPYRRRRVYMDSLLTATLPLIHVLKDPVEERVVFQRATIELPVLLEHWIEIQHRVIIKVICNIIVCPFCIVFRSIYV